jgi:DNA-binding NarL/FixJ family response regulator
VTGVLVADDSTTAGAQAAVLRARPDVVLVPLDPRPAFDAVEFAEVLASTGVPVVALTRGAAPAPAHGAAPVVVVPARAGLDELRAAVTRVLHAPGGSSPAPDAGTAAGSRQRDGRVDAAHDQRAAARMMARLSPRERQLLEQLMLGRTAVEISHADSVSEATVRTQIRSILTKLEVTSQITAVAIARLAGWHPDSSGQPSWRR